MIGSFGMALRYSFGLIEAADLSTAPSPTCWGRHAHEGHRGAGANAVGTGEMGDAILHELERLS
jgi:3-isopropylmalate dehydrogenase